jgi:hypothetical protein
MNMTHDEFDAEVGVITQWLATAAHQIRQVGNINEIRAWAEQLMHAIQVLTLAGVHATYARYHIGLTIENWEADLLVLAADIEDTARYFAYWADVVVDRYNAMVIHRDLQSADNNIAELARNWQAATTTTQQHLIHLHPELVPRDLIIKRIPESRTLTYAPVEETFECPICMCDIEGRGPESIPIVGDTVEGEAWQCKQCGHHICKPCMEQWTGSNVEFDIPNDNGEQQLVERRNERHNTCPYCRSNIWA